MDLEIINPYIMKIIIAAREKDSINSLARRIKVSYGWTYKWVKELAMIGVFKLYRMKIRLNKENSFYKKVLKFIKVTFRHDVSFFYSAICLFGIQYCFTKTDSVFVWTKGAYNIGRYKNHYPIFIKIMKKDKEIFYYYMKKLGLNRKQGIYFSLEFVEEIECDFLDNIPVDSLKDTIKFMRKYIYNFEPALEMIEKMYNIKTGVNYQEAFTNV
ncbi:MAG: hypothetical protein V1740_06175 [Candidatus Woesearchaeota archaeon]